MSAYVDTSALVKLLVAEPGSVALRASWRALGDHYASVVGYVEIRGSVARAARYRRVAPADVPDLRRRLEVVWRRIVTVAVEPGLVRDAGELAERHALSALDAIHLASALTLVGGSGRPAFVTFDRRLREAAAAEGFRVLPEVA